MQTYTKDNLGFLRVPITRAVKEFGELIKNDAKQGNKQAAHRRGMGLKATLETLPDWLELTEEGYFAQDKDGNLYDVRTSPFTPSSLSSAFGLVSASRPIDERVDYYVFHFLDKNKNQILLGAYISREEFLRKARKMKSGESLFGNGMGKLTYDSYVLPVSEMTMLNDLVGPKFEPMDVFMDQPPRRQVQLNVEDPIEPEPIKDEATGHSKFRPVKTILKGAMLSHRDAFHVLQQQGFDLSRQRFNALFGKGFFEWQTKTMDSLFYIRTKEFVDRRDEIVGQCQRGSRPKVGRPTDHIEWVPHCSRPEELKSAVKLRNRLGMSVGSIKDLANKGTIPCYQRRVNGDLDETLYFLEDEILQALGLGG